jgi:nucleoside-diphosphate-sugar epimerase
MSILITGANGAIGCDLVSILSKKYNIIAVYRTKRSKLKKIKNVKWIKSDLKEKINQRIKPFPKYIIHCAVDQQPSRKKNIKEYIFSNLIILKNIIDFAKKNKVKLIINLSSIESYGDIKTTQLKEDYLSKKPNVYGMTKLLSEDVLSSQKTNFINLRLPGVLCEPSKNKFTRPWLSSLFFKIKNNQKVTVHNLKSYFNSVISTYEIANLTSFLIKKKITIRDTFNFASLKPMILKDLIDLGKKKLNYKNKIIEKKNQDNNSFYISTKKLKKKLKYKTQTTQQLIELYLEKLLQHER